MRRLALLVAVVFGLAAPSALAVNDPFAPGDTCGSSTAIGHPAFVNEQADPASPTFSSNNPGVSTGAKGDAENQAPCG